MIILTCIVLTLLKIYENYFAGMRKIRLIGVGISSIYLKESEQMQQMELDFGIL